MNAFIAVAKKELASVLRDRTIIIAILIQLFIASFSSALLIGMLSLYDADSASVYSNIHINVAMVGPQSGSNGDASLLSGYLANRGVYANWYASLDQAQVDFFQGKVRAILVLPADGNELVQVKLYLPSEQALASIILNLLQDPLRRYENSLRAERGIIVRYTDLKGQPPTTFEFIYSVILPILMLFPAFVAGGMVVDSISEEVENDTLETLLSAPLSLRTVVGGKSAAALLLAVIQCLAWLALLRLNHVMIHHFWLVLALAAITAGIVTLAAAAITVWLRDRERSQFVFSLSLLAAAGGSFLLDVSPIKTLSRLAIGDFYTGLLDVLLFGVFLVGLGLLTWWLTGRQRG